MNSYCELPNTPGVEKIHPWFILDQEKVLQNVVFMMNIPVVNAALEMGFREDW